MARVRAAGAALETLAAVVAATVNPRTLGAAAAEATTAPREASAGAFEAARIVVAPVTTSSAVTRDRPSVSESRSLPFLPTLRLASWKLQHVVSCAALAV